MEEKDLGYVKGLRSHWVTLMSGIVSLLISAGQYGVTMWFPKVDWLKNFPGAKTWAGIGMSCIFWASFLAWKDERNKVISLRAELSVERNNNRPKLVGSFLQTLGGDNSAGTGAAAWIEMQIVNQGSPSIVLPNSWRSRVILSDGTIHSASLLTISDGYKIQMLDGVSHSIGEKDAIYNSASVDAIERGGIAHGWLLVEFIGASWMQLISPGSVWEVSGEDALCNPWVVTFTYKGSEAMNGPMHYPGSAVIK